MLQSSHAQSKPPCGHFDIIGKHLNVVVSSKKSTGEDNHTLGQETSRANGVTSWETCQFIVDHILKPVGSELTSIRIPGSLRSIH